MTNWWDDVDFDRPEVVARYDELPLWSAPFGQLTVPMACVVAGPLA